MDRTYGVGDIEQGRGLLGQHAVHARGPGIAAQLLHQHLVQVGGVGPRTVGPLVEGAGVHDGGVEGATALRHDHVQADRCGAR